jgi:hypothetical protein
MAGEFLFLDSSGFPVPSKHPGNPYCESPWNLNKMSTLPSSLFGNIKTDIAGMMVPWLYVGMVFSTFCWHFEDHYTYSINYNHIGAAKTWYGIPGDYAEAFEHVMKEENKELFDKDPDLLFHLTTLISPGVLKSKGVKVVVAHQQPGEFIVTFPRAYHAGFNQGFNIAEAVNFAPTDWLPLGADCVKLYTHYKKLPVFSHEEMVLRTIDNGFGLQAATDLQDEIHRILMDEKGKRAVIHSKLTITEKVVPKVVIADDKDQCKVCKQFCFLSAVVCANGCEGVLCFEHASEPLDCCEKKEKVLEVRYTLEMLDEFHRKVDRIAEPPRSWLNKLAKVESGPTPLLNTLLGLVKEAQDLGYLSHHYLCLRRRVTECLKWQKEASQVLTSESLAKKADDRFSKVISLLSQLGPLKFTCIEAARLIREYDNGKALERRIRHVLQSRERQTQSDLLYLYNQGMRLGAESALLTHLDLRIRQEKFYTRFGSVTNFGMFPLEQLEQILHEAKHLEVKDISEVAGRTYMAGLYLNSQVSQFFVKSDIDLEEMERFASQIRNVPVTSSVRREFDRIYHQVISITQRVSAVLKGVPTPQTLTSLITLSPNQHIAYEILEHAAQLNVRFKHVQVLTDAYYACEAWKVKVVMLLTGSDKRQLVECLTIMRDSLFRVSKNDSHLVCLCRSNPTPPLVSS